MIVYTSAIFSTLILPACEEYGIQILQMDNARPHIINNANVFIDDFMARHLTATLLRQPPMSSDLNPFDQGVFNILADAVEAQSPTTRNELHDAYSMHGEIFLRVIFYPLS